MNGKIAIRLALIVGVLIYAASISRVWALSGSVGDNIFQPWFVNSTVVPATAAAGSHLVTDVNASPSWAPAGGAAPSPQFFSPTAISALPTCTAGGVNQGARAFVNNGNCSGLFGTAAVATATSFCIQPVWCGAQPTATTGGGGGTVGWFVGRNDKCLATSSPWQLGRAYPPYSAGGAIPGKGLLERWVE